MASRRKPGPTAQTSRPFPGGSRLSPGRRSENLPSNRCFRIISTAAPDQCREADRPLLRAVAPYATFSVNSWRRSSRPAREPRSAKRIVKVINRNICAAALAQAAGRLTGPSPRSGAGSGQNCLIRGPENDQSRARRRGEAKSPTGAGVRRRNSASGVAQESRHPGRAGRKGTAYPACSEAFSASCRATWPSTSERPIRSFM